MPQLILGSSISRSSNFVSFHHATTFFPCFPHFPVLPTVIVRRTPRIKNLLVLPRATQYSGPSFPRHTPGTDLPVDSLPRGPTRILTLGHTIFYTRYGHPTIFECSSSPATLSYLNVNRSNPGPPDSPSFLHFLSFIVIDFHQIDQDNLPLLHCRRLHL